jgi:hypothetical protein
LYDARNYGEESMILASVFHWQKTLFRMRNKQDNFQSPVMKFLLNTAVLTVHENCYTAAHKLADTSISVGSVYAVLCTA